jgi:hypothetical protein
MSAGPSGNQWEYGINIMGFQPWHLPIVIREKYYSGIDL